MTHNIFIIFSLIKIRNVLFAVFFFHWKNGIKLFSTPKVQVLCLKSPKSPNHISSNLVGIGACRKK